MVMITHEEKLQVKKLLDWVENILKLVRSQALNSEGDERKVS